MREDISVMLVNLSGPDVCALEEKTSSLAAFSCDRQSADFLCRCSDDSLPLELLSGVSD